MKNFTFDQLARYFDRRARGAPSASFANGYSTTTENLAELYAEIVAELHGLAPVPPSARVLEIGCGTGEILTRFGAGAASAVGIDISAEMVQAARARGLEAVHYDGGRLPFPDGLFDAVLIYQVLTNFPTLDAARHLVREGARVLAPGGRLIVGAVPDPVSSGFPEHRGWSLRRLKALVRSWLSGGRSIGYYSYPAAFFANLYEEMGFESLTLSRCRVSRQGWATKYHAALQKR